ncbi:MAG: pilus assembly protein [Planctomycetia bacterium]|nr:pilus assembly protein [Planctomycetia bacterium]
MQKSITSTVPKKPNSRKGSFTLELVLILPIVVTTILLVYQVAVMLSTYQALRSAAFHSALVFSEAPQEKLGDLTREAVFDATRGYFFAAADINDDMIKLCTSQDEWEAAATNFVIKYRLLTGEYNHDWSTTTNKYPHDWTYYNPTAADPVAVKRGQTITVEIKLENLSQFRQYWLLSLLDGVGTETNAKSDVLTISQTTKKQ